MAAALVLRAAATMLAAFISMPRRCRRSAIFRAFTICHADMR